MRAHNIWKNCNFQLAKIIKMKSTDLNKKSFYMLIRQNSDEDLVILQNFEIEEIHLKTLEEYDEFIENMTACKVWKFIKINRLRLSLSFSDDFDKTYFQASEQTIYNENDKKFDIKYNHVIKLIENLDISVRQIESMLQVNEIQNREIEYLERAILIVNDDIIPSLFSSYISSFESKPIVINRLSIIFKEITSIKGSNLIHPHWDIFKQFPWKYIEIYISCQNK